MSQRAEATQGFAAVRQLAVGESAAIAIVLVELLRSKSLYAIVACEVVVVGLVFFAARWGRDWYIQAIRQVAYLLIAYELPERDRINATPGADPAMLWFLADRSESFDHTRVRDDGRIGASRQQRFRTHLPGRELHTFLAQQLWLVVIDAVAAVIALVRTFPIGAWFHPSTATAAQLALLTAFQADVVLMLVAIAFTFIVIWFLVREISRSDQAINRLTLNWVEYFAQRRECEETYLKKHGLLGSAPPRAAT